MHDIMSQNDDHIDRKIIFCPNFTRFFFFFFFWGGGAISYAYVFDYSYYLSYLFSILKVK